MTKEKSLFYKLIKCEVCGMSYSRINEGRHIYVCGGYKKGKCDKRRVIEEEDLLFMIKGKYSEIELTNNFMKSIIHHIIVDKDSNVFIYYNNGENSYFTATSLKR